MINTHLIYSTIIISGFSLVILIFCPNLDIGFSKFFYSNIQGFIYKNNFLVLYLFKVIPIATKLLTASCIAYLLYKLLKYKKLKNILLSSTFYLIITGLIGPGLIVNCILKENFGRARPMQTTYFNGFKSFSPALFISDQCNHNCSFSSGHAATAYYFTVFAYMSSYNNLQLPNLLTLKRKVKKPSELQKKNFTFNTIYIIGLLFGSLVGLSRILMGGHFLSDVIASCFIVLIVNHLLYLWWQRMNMSNSNVSQVII